ncbi:MAG: NAD(P)/FAD-dependent oxidoreductase [bacterium]
MIADDGQRIADAQRIAVVGAGIVGICCALWLRRGGHRVVLVDGNAPGAGASSGSACTIAVHGCIPVNHPRLIARLPQRLLDRRGGPLTLDPLYVARHLPWCWRFLKHCRAGAVADTTAALASLLAHARAGLTPLIEMAAAADLLDHRGCLYAYRTERDFRAERESLRIRRAHGVRCTVLNAGELRELEPHLKIDFARGVLFDDAQRVVDPQALATRLFECFRRGGGEWSRHHVIEMRARDHGVEMRLANGESLRAGRAVLAAGAFSKQVAGAGVARLPLDAERGHHVQFNGRQQLARRPLHWVGSGFYATPTADALRFAGTVEIAGLSSRQNPRVLAYLTRMAKRMFDLDGAPTQTWLGHRPTFPDALPVIGPSAKSPRILLAFGHQHLGLTLAGITGKLIAQLIDDAPPEIDLTAFSARRFE